MDSKKLQGVDHCIDAYEQVIDFERCWFRIISILERTQPFMYWDMFAEMLMGQIFGQLDDIDEAWISNVFDCMYEMRAQRRILRIPCHPVDWYTGSIIYGLIKPKDPNCINID